MISGDWKQRLNPTLRPKRNPPAEAGSRLVIAGVGQALRGDDGIGVAVAERLVAVGRDDASTRVVVAGHALENCLGPIARFNPAVVLFVDAAALDGPAGTIRLLEATDAAEMPGTHTPSLGVAARYLAAETGCSVYLLAVSPADTSFDAALSSAGDAAVETIVEALMQV
jgi:hydrogenase maturation protease